MTPAQIIESNKANCSWVHSYGLLVDLCEEINASSLVEIGVAYGYHAQYVLNHLDSINYIGIDPYKANYDKNDSFCKDVHSLLKGSNEQDSMDLLYEGVKENLSKYLNAKLLRETFQSAYSLIADDSIDVIFVDGDHTYNGVFKDLEVALKKVNKSKGIICGDDINWDSVKSACDNFTVGNNLSYSIEEKNSGRFFVIRFNS